MNRVERMTELLMREFQPALLKLTDESAKHAGHAGASPQGETHYHLIIESAHFVGMNKVRRHQAIYQLLAAEFASGLHALSIEAMAPGERKA